MRYSYAILRAILVRFLWLDERPYLWALIYEIFLKTFYEEKKKTDFFDNFFIFSIKMIIKLY